MFRPVVAIIRFYHSTQLRLFYTLLFIYHHMHKFLKYNVKPNLVKTLM